MPGRYGDWGWMGGAGWPMVITWLLLTVVVASVIWAVLRITTPARGRSTFDPAERELRERFARGEIDAEEFRSRVDTLHRHRRDSA